MWKVYCCPSLAYSTPYTELKQKDRFKMDKVITRRTLSDDIVYYNDTQKYTLGCVTLLADKFYFHRG